MTASVFDTSKKDPWSVNVAPTEPADFDIAAYADFAASADERFEQFWQKDSGVMVWQRVRAGAVFRDACADMKESLRLQLGALNKTMHYKTDAATYLEPWYGIGTTAAAFGGEYTWLPGQAPAMEARYMTVEEVPDLVALPHEDVPILQYTLQTIAYFLEQTKGHIPVSWCDIQHPFNSATMLIDTSAYMMGLIFNPEKIMQINEALTDELIAFTKVQTDLIGDALARPGHGFAASRKGTGIALSTDNLIMISPADYQKFFGAASERIGNAFGGVMLHSCGNWGKWIGAAKSVPNMILLDAAFSPRTDPTPNNPEEWRDALAESGIVLHARIVAPAEEVISYVKRLWTPGLKLVVSITNSDPTEQHKLYDEIHAICR